jgi:hypothetical protein
LQFFGYITHLHFACQTRQQNSTQQPNATQQSTLKPVNKESGKKKGQQWLSGRLLTIKYTHSPSDILLLKSIIPKQPNPNKPHTTISLI